MQTIPIRETMRSQWNGNSGEEKKRDGGAATQRRAGTGGKHAAQGKGEKEAQGSSNFEHSRQNPRAGNVLWQWLRIL